MFLFDSSLQCSIYSMPCVSSLGVMIAANVERVCEEAELAFLLLHLRSVVDYCFTVER